MTKKVKFKSLLLLCFGLLMGSVGFSQSTVFSLNSSATYAGLDSLQKANYDKIVSQGAFKPEIKFLNYDGEAIFDVDGLLKLGVGNFIDSFEFKATKVDFQSTNDYSWTGEYVNYDTTIDNTHGVLSFLSKNGVLFGTLQVDNKSYQIYDLTGGLSVLAEFDLNNETSSVCGNGEEISEEFEGLISKPCKGDKLRILIVFTTGAAAIEPDIMAKAQGSINELAYIWANSGANVIYPELAGVEVVDLTESTIGYPLTRMENDLTSFKSNVNVVNFRNSYKADIVVFMTKAAYEGINGLVNDDYGIGADYDNAFAIVSANYAVGGRKVFSHEVSHLFGARHDFDATTGFAHGYKFKGGKIQRYTLMAALPLGRDRIHNVSNPLRDFLLKPTGIVNERDNVRKIEEFSPTIANFYSDDVQFVANITFSGPAKCQQYGTATANVPQECRGPYAYQWEYSDNGVVWSNVSGGTTQTISTFVPYPLFSTMAGTFNARQYRVTVTGFAAQGIANGTAYYSCVPRIINGKLQNALQLNKGISIFPNPIASLFSLEFSLENSESFTLTITDNCGKIVKNTSIGKLAKGLNKLDFQRDFAPGVYFVILESENCKFVGKIVAN